MKKSLIALAVMAAAGAASAQSSVTLFGVVDVNYNYVKADGNGHVSRITDSGYNSSRLGFRGTEDLGGGMSASFWLEAGLNPDNGTGDSTNTTNQFASGAPAGTGTAGSLQGGQGVVFNRRSTVSLAGGWGELRLGRDYVPAFWNLTVFDPFGTQGVGASTNMTIGAGLGTSAVSTGVLPTTTRASNSIGYFLPPNLGGFYGQAMYALGENASNAGATADDGNHWGVRLGFASGPFNIAAAYGQTTFAASALGGDYTAMNIGGQWDFGMFKLMGQWAVDELDSTAVGIGGEQESFLLGGLMPVGAGEIRASYIHTNVKRSSAGAAGDDGDQFAIGYVHNLSKRTAVYATYARVDNKGAGRLFNNGRALGATSGGGSTDGFDLGIRHSF
jgi:predicted porin